MHVQYIIFLIFLICASFLHLQYCMHGSMVVEHALSNHMVLKMLRNFGTRLQQNLKASVITGLLATVHYTFFTVTVYRYLQNSKQIIDSVYQLFWISFMHPNCSTCLQI